MSAVLHRLNAGLPDNRHAWPLSHGRNRMSMSPLEPLPPPPNLDAVKAEIERCWPGTGLLDRAHLGDVDGLSDTGKQAVVALWTVRQGS